MCPSREKEKRKARWVYVYKREMSRPRFGLSLYMTNDITISEVAVADATANPQALRPNCMYMYVLKIAKLSLFIWFMRLENNKKKNAARPHPYQAPKSLSSPSVTYIFRTQQLEGRSP